jgi:phosphatidylethanolamine-binding protein (PEBP) family uncharacterized protein
MASYHVEDKQMIKRIFVTLPTVALLVAANASALEVQFADKAWDGKTVPVGQQCQKFGGINPATPALKVSDIPNGATSLALEYSDRDSERMNNGGHGRLNYALGMSVSMVNVPSVAGHTFDIPMSFTSVEAHRSPGWDKAGAYMPPCSGGKGHAYYVTVKALKGDDVLSQSVLEMGRF